MNCKDRQIEKQSEEEARIGRDGYGTDNNVCPVRRSPIPGQTPARANFDHSATWAKRISILLFIVVF
ncbi:hypothetical protein ElyMa_005480800 [Elysia marginata]|uniref:Uncharacterized protein n=1 Tax=Elysia marginata TaxID=1093978 RepID=A0AAV4ET12_9GAST|nr:hypothetical protein ElyMa_005480800 [Elysia marginata]